MVLKKHVLCGIRVATVVDIQILFCSILLTIIFLYLSFHHLPGVFSYIHTSNVHIIDDNDQ